MVDVYIIFENNEEEYEDYFDWIKEIYFDKEKAENRFFELIKTNRYTKDNKIKKVRYGRDIGAYRLEKNKIIDSEDITIFGKTIKEIMTILNGLDVERMTGIEMTMENLSCLFEKVMEEHNKRLQEQIENMFIEKGGKLNEI